MAEIHLACLDRSNEGLKRKLKVDHGLDWFDVDEAILHHRIGRARMVRNRKHGLRLRVEAMIPAYNRTIVAYLKPVDKIDGIWVVKTAY